MKIAVIAADGRSGREFVRQALDSGHQVRAGVRRIENYPIKHPKLKLQICNGENLDQVSELLSGQEAVVSLIGHVKGSPANIQTQTIKNVVSAMTQEKIKRLVSLTGTAVRFPGDKITLFDRLINFGITTIDPARIKDGINHANVLRESNLDWTIIRVLKLQNTKPRAFSLKAHGPTKSYVSRKEVARAILEVLRDKTFIRQAPIISKP